MKEVQSTGQRQHEPLGISAKTTRALVIGAMGVWVKVEASAMAHL